MRKGYMTNLDTDLIKNLKLKAVELDCNQNDVLESLIYIGLKLNFIEDDKMKKYIKIRKGE